MTFARLGGRAALCGRMGRDRAGRVLSDELAAAGVDTGFVARAGGASGIVVNLETGGETSHLSCEGANADLCDDDARPGMLCSARIVCLNSVFGCGRITERTMRAARAAGCVTAADTTTPPAGASLGDIAPLLSQLDWFLPSISEAAALTGSRDPVRCARAFHGAGVKNVVIKLGADGCFLSTEQLVEQVEGFRVAQVRDLTGCGDSFVAAFLAALADGLPHRECAVRANAAGALTAGRVGSSGAVTAEGLDRFLKLKLS